MTFVMIESLRVMMHQSWNTREAFVAKAAEVMKFKIVYPEGAVLSEGDSDPFPPEFVHQVFGMRETIFGYKNLKIEICYHHNTAECLVKIEWSDRFVGNGTVEADNLLLLLAPYLPRNFFTDPNAFRDALVENINKVYGIRTHSFVTKEESGFIDVYYVTHCSLTDPDFKEFHRRFEKLIIWFIDAANYVDLEDPKWELYYLYQQGLSSLISPVGFCAVYKFYAYPDKNRARISQFFILPNHQKKGLGKRFLTCVYQNLWDMECIKDITVESPSTVFSHVRSMVEARSVALKAGVDPSKFPKYMTEEFEAKLVRELKLCPERCRIIFDIWRRRMYGPNNPDVIQDIQNRLKREYLKKLRTGNSTSARAQAAASVDSATMRREIIAAYRNYVFNVLEPTASKIHVSLVPYTITALLPKGTK